MIQDTTLRMILQAVDQASGPLTAVQEKVNGLTNSIEGVKDTASDSLPAVGKAASDIVDDFDDLRQSAGEAAFALGPSMVEAAVVAAIALVSLIKYLKEVSAEHERIRDVAETLSLPYDEVKNYSEVWLDVAQSLSEAARGYKELSSAQQAAMKAIGLDPTNLREASAVKSFISVGKGTNLEKVDALRRLYGLNDEKALAIIKDENRKFFAEVADKLQLSESAFRQISSGNDTGFSPDFARRVREFRTSAGVGFGDLNVGQLTPRIPTPLGAKDSAENIKFAEDAINDLNNAVRRTQEIADRNNADLRKDAAKAAQQSMRDDYDRRAEIAQQGTKIAEEEAKATAKSLAENDREIARSANDAWKQVGEAAAVNLKQVEFPVNEFVETWKDAMKEMVYYGDFSFKRLIARIVIELASKRLFDAIDRVGDALSDAFSGSGGGGGLFSKVGSFLGGIFGNAGGGQESGLRWVGEEGPELVASGPNAMRVYNMRQMAFAGGAGGSKQTVHYHDNRNYSISGVETQQVIGYIEQTRREDQRGIVRMLERNGLGSMR